MGDAEVLERLVAWGEAQSTVLAMIITSSRARPDGAVDILSDYDLILVVTDPERFAEDRAWESDYGEPMVRWGDPAETWSELEGTYVGPDTEENCDALFRLTALFRRVAREVGEMLGYEYPQQVDDQVTAYLEGVRKLP
jgi:hypothetical protein